MKLTKLMEVAKLRGKLKSKLYQLAKHDLLIIDEFGYLPINKQGNHNFFSDNIMYEHRSTVLTTNRKFTQ